MSAYWLCQVFGWLGINIAIVLIQVAYGAPYWKVEFYVSWAIFIVSGIGISHGWRAVLKARSWMQLPAGRGLGLLGAGVLATGLVLGIIEAVCIAGGSLPKITPTSVIAAVMNATGMMLGWTVIYAAAGWYRAAQQSRVEAGELRYQAQHAQLRALESQLNPHFLFNALNSVRALITEDPPRAADMVTQLSGLLRYSLRSNRRDTVPFAEEQAMVEDYLAIERTRFEDRLNVEFAIDPEARELPIPPMLLQTLVENALKHGIARRPEGGTVRVEAHAVEGKLQLAVTNSGRLREDSGGVGLENARQRLRLLFGERARLTLASHGAEAVRATLEFT